MKTEDIYLDEKDNISLEENVQAPLAKTKDGIVLVPQPTDDPADPLNWSWGWKHWILFQVALASHMAPYTAAGIIPGFEAIAAEFHTSVNAISYQVGVHVLGLGCGNFVWTPLGNSFGRRPVYICAMLLSLAGNIGGCRAPSYGTLMLARFFQALGAGAPAATGASTIADIFFLHERGAKTGLWTYPTTIGPYVSPLVGGFLIQAKGWRWAIILMAIINAVQLVVMIFTLPETMFIRRHLTPETTSTEAIQNSSRARKHPIYFNLTRPFWKPIGRKLTFVDFLRPLQMLRYPNVLVIVLPYVIGVAYADVGITNLIPQTFGPLYGFDPAQQGLSFIGFLIGCFFGEMLSGKLSDIIIAFRVRRNGGEFVPEMRLTPLPIGFILLPLGLILWGVFVDMKTHWIGPVIAGGIAICGLQIIVTIGTTYLIDCYKPQAAISSTTIVCCRQIFSFTIPFYNFAAAEKLGFTNWFAVQFSITVLSCVPALFLFRWGATWRERWGKPTFHDEL